MRIATYPADVETLLGFMKRMGFRAEEVDYAVVEVECEEASARAKLALYLRVWERIESGREAKIVDA